MKFITSIAATFSSLLLVQPTLVEGQSGFSGLFTQLLNAFARPVLQEVCDLTLAELGLDTAIDCTCNATYRGLFLGADGSIGCTLSEPRCLIPPDTYCATGEVNVTAGGGLFTDTAIESDISACFEVDSGLPGGIASIEDLCFVFVPSGLSLASCNASIGGVECDSCTICDSGVDFTFDCSNIDLLPGVFTFPGPKISNCIGLSLIPSGTATP